MRVLPELEARQIIFETEKAMIAAEEGRSDDQMARRLMVAFGKYHTLDNCLRTLSDVKMQSRSRTVVN